MKIQVLLHSVQAICAQDRQDMTVKFQRGPQVDETRRFEMETGKAVVDIRQTFIRSSGFYFDEKIGQWMEKICQLSLGFYEGNNWTMVGTIKINMSEMAEKGDVTKVFKLEGGSNYPVSQAQCEATFRIDSGKSGSLEKSADRISRTIVSSKTFDEEEFTAGDDLLPQNMLTNPLHQSMAVGSRMGNTPGKSEIPIGNESKKVKDLMFLLEDRDSLIKDRDFDFQRFKSKIEKQNKAFGQAKEEMGTLVDILMVAGKKIDSLEADKPSLEQANKTLTAQNEAKDAQIQQLMELLAYSERKLEQKEQEVAKKEKEVSDIKVKFAKVTAQLEKLNQGSGFLGLF